MASSAVREIFFYEDHFMGFYEELSASAQRKMDWTLNVIRTMERVPVKYLKHLEGTMGLYEVRVETGSDIHRVVCFFDAARMIILLNGFNKKTQRTPRTEIERAEKLRQQYDHEKDR